MTHGGNMKLRLSFLRKRTNAEFSETTTVKTFCIVLSENKNAALSTIY